MNEYRQRARALNAEASVQLDTIDKAKEAQAEIAARMECLLGDMLSDLDQPFVEMWIDPNELANLRFGVSAMIQRHYTEGALSIQVRLPKNG